MERKNTWHSYTEEDIEKLESLASDYKEYLTGGKTERECVKESVKLAQRAGYEDLEHFIAENKQLKPGDKVYRTWMDKTIVLFQIGEKPMEDGLNILGAHIDSPRMDLKQNPLYEDTEMVLLDTHYYGGVKKYQWVTLPLSLHGVVIKKDGTTIEISIGEKDTDPVVGVTDLLIHLSAQQLEKKAKVVIEGEDLNVLIGSRPVKGEEKDAVKKEMLRILEQEYGIEEEDFLSAEIEVVPAGPARDFGLDRSMIMSYGQDDRVCAYTALTAEIDAKKPAHTTVTILADKEEIGSTGNTGLNSDFVLHYIEDLAEQAGVSPREVLRKSLCLSSDVNAAFDPNFPDVYEGRNTSYINKGCVLTKYTGARGKSGSNDASAETMAKVIAIMEEEGVYWQAGELGAVDVGGGGTIAQFVAHMDVDTVDLGVPILSMHSPFELASKLDVYHTYKAFKAFYK